MMTFRKSCSKFTSLFSHLARRKAIDAAKKLYAARGAQALSVRGIAAELGFSTGGLYRYFVDGHDEILATVRCDCYRTLIGLLQSASKKSSDPLGQIDLLADAFFDFAIHHSTDFELLFVYQEGDWDSCPELVELEAQCWNRLKRFFKMAYSAANSKAIPRF